MLTTPGGKPALATNSANFKDVSGVTWKDLHITHTQIFIGIFIEIFIEIFIHHKIGLSRV